MPSLIPLHGCLCVNANPMPVCQYDEFCRVIFLLGSIGTEKKIGPPGLFRRADRLQGVGV